MPWRFLALFLIGFGMTSAGAQSLLKSGDDISQAKCCNDFMLTDLQGKPRSLSEFRGKVSVLFFGFTQCPEVCPTTLLDLTAMLDELGPGRDSVQIIFVTIDPERDTPEFLSKYLADFDRGILGLHGSPEATRKVAQEFRIFYRKRPLSGEDYTMDHTAGAYIIDQKSKARVFVPYGAKPSIIAADVRMLLADRN